jgi:hypothetical protein
MAFGATAVVGFYLDIVKTTWEDFNRCHVIYVQYVSCVVVKKKSFFLKGKDVLQNALLTKKEAKMLPDSTEQ